ncbi:MAG TPA: iron-containing redox enzyme family protein [Terriglobales bacterium]|jgi:pyrroloquinoline-quinone synthase|nr:iron-containing redox enzyme family protein [Terriglobales bacterium]
MNLRPFWQELNARIAKYDLLCHPFYQAWTMGHLTRDDLRAYAADYYHHVAAFPEYLRIFEERLNTAADQCATPEMAQTVSQNRADEEGVGSPDRRSHAELWLDFAEGMGANRTMVKGNKPVAEVRELIAAFEKVAKEGSPAEALAAFYAYESQVPRVAKEKAAGLQERYGADGKTCSYFTLHTTADVLHAQVWQNLLEAQVSMAGDDGITQALDAAEKTAQALWRALDGIERERLERAAA